MAGGLENQKAKLKKIDCAAILTLGFGEFTSVSGVNLIDIRKQVDAKIAKGRSDDAFWKSIDSANAENQRDKKRQRDETTLPPEMAPPQLRRSD